MLTILLYYWHSSREKRKHYCSSCLVPIHLYSFFEGQWNRRTTRRVVGGRHHGPRIYHARTDWFQSDILLSAPYNDNPVEFGETHMLLSPVHELPPHHRRPAAHTVLPAAAHEPHASVFHFSPWRSERTRDKDFFLL
jgi:hypothetical protein